MPVCCRCNGSGRCVSCSCWKSGEILPPTNCLPPRLGQCRNTGARDRLVDTSPDHPESTVPVNAQPLVTPVVVPDCSTQEDRAGDPHEDSTVVANAAEILPPYTPSSTVGDAYRWGTVDGPTFCAKVNRCYEETVHWQRNVFTVHSGRVGKRFVAEMAHLYSSYAEESQIESFALTATMILPPLVLQKPFQGSKAKEHVKCMKGECSYGEMEILTAYFMRDLPSSSVLGHATMLPTTMKHVRLQTL